MCAGEGIHTWHDFWEKRGCSWKSAHGTAKVSMDAGLDAGVQGGTLGIGGGRGHNIYQSS